MNKEMLLQVDCCTLLSVYMCTYFAKLKISFAGYLTSLGQDLHVKE